VEFDRRFKGATKGPLELEGARNLRRRAVRKGKSVLVQIFLRVCFCPCEKALQILGGEDRCPRFRSGGCFSGQWFDVELLFLDFVCQLECPELSRPPSRIA
jgi:hypothetical protein